MSKTPEVVNDTYALYNGDCVEVMRHMPEDSIDYSIYSPPFASLYTYSDSPNDMGNARDYEEFFAQYAYFVAELYRVTKPGRLTSFHCAQIPLMKERDGVIGLRDFRGRLIKTYEDFGFILHAESVIWKDPVTEMQRTKALGLLHKQIKKDSSMSRMGIPDYVITMRKPGDNAEPIQHFGSYEELVADSIKHSRVLTEANNSLVFPVDQWQEWASPVWMDIDQSRTLNFMKARDIKDERHICPLQLDVIERCLTLWSNPGDVVLSPFAGIGSEGYVAVQHGRRFVGIELKPSYYKWAVKHLAEAAALASRQTIFDAMDEQTEIELVEAA